MRYSNSPIALLIICALLTMLMPSAIADSPAPHENPSVPAEMLSDYLNPLKLRLRSSHAVIYDNVDHTVLYQKGENESRPIASLTKLMTAMVILDAKLDMSEVLTILRKDRDRLRGSRSRLAYGTRLSRQDALLISLAASENRAATALARTFPGGKKAFIDDMNKKAASLGMKDTLFVDSTGLHSENVSTPQDLVKLVNAAYQYDAIRDMTTTGRSSVTDLRTGYQVKFLNTNRLVRRKNWDIDISKTGYIADAGHCLVMMTQIDDRPLTIVLLNSWGKYSKFGDANRIKRWFMRANKRAYKRFRETVAEADIS